MTFQKDGSWRFIVDLCDARWFDRVNTTQHVTVWIKRNGCKKPMELDISVTAPFLLTTHVRTTTEFTEGGEETSSVTSFVPFGVLATLSDVVDDLLHVTSVKLETAQGLQVKNLKPGMKPVAVFALADGDEPVAAYEYCNLHGLWKAEV